MGARNEVENDIRKMEELEGGQLGHQLFAFTKGGFYPTALSSYNNSFDSGLAQENSAIF